MAKKKKLNQIINNSIDSQTQDDMQSAQNLPKSRNFRGNNTTGPKRHKTKFSFRQENGLSTQGVTKPWKQVVENYPTNSEVRVRHAVNPGQGAEAMPFKPAKIKKATKQKRIKDLRLIPRIQEYLDTRTNKKVASVPLMAEYLQRKYPEYSRRNRSMFTKYIDRAYSQMDQQDESQSSSSEFSDSDTDGTNLEDGKTHKKRRRMQSGDEDDKSDVEEILVEYKDTNAMNSMMSGMYKSSSQHSADNTSEKSDYRSSVVSNSGALNRHDNLSRHFRSRETSAECYFIDKQDDNSAISAPNKHKRTYLNKPDFLFKNSDSPSGTLPENLWECDRNSSHSQEKSTKASAVCVKPLAERSIDMTGDVSGAQSFMSNDVIVDRNEEEIVIDSDSEEVSIQNSDGTKACNIVKEKETFTPRRIKKQKVSAKSRSINEGSKSTDSNEAGPVLEKSTVTFADIGGNEQSLIEICKLLVHMKHPEVYQQLGVTPPRGFLLHGPPGCGKTLLANAIAGELDLPMIKIAATEIVSGVSGDSEEKVRELFEKATLAAPCVLFIDEVDAITPKRETASKDMERRIVSQLLTCMDDLNKNTEAHVLVIGATNRPDSLDPALRRAGRFDKEICLGIPDENSRKRILEVLCRNLRLTPGFDFSYLATFTPGFVGADLMSLTREAAMVAVNRVFRDLQTSGASDINSQTGNKESCEQQIRKCDQTVDTGLPDNIFTDATSVSRNSKNEKVTSSSCFMKNKLILNQNGISDISVNESEICSTTCDGNEMDTEILEANSNDNREPNQDCAINGEVILISEEGNSSGAENQSTRDISGVSHTVMGDCDISVTQEASISDENVTQNGTELSSKGTDKTVEEKELSSVLSWLKDQPPLTEEQLRDLFVTLDDFKIALQSVQPSAKREGFATVPDVTWDDIGALHNVREELQLAILAPVRHPAEFKALGLNRAQGILLAGPPGCGKTLLAKAVANESGINFISVKGPELLNMYVGESEKAVRTVFQRARNSSPCVIFFDELDALCPRRSGSADGGSSTRVVNQLLTEMDGLEERKQVFIMAATNRPDIIDPAVLRPGRLDKTLYVGLPSELDRLDILKCLTKNGSQPLLAEDVDMELIAGDQRCENYTGADLAALVREASVSALKEAISKTNRSAGVPIAVNSHHFETAFKKIKPSVSVKDRERYISMQSKLATE